MAGRPTERRDIPAATDVRSVGASTSRAPFWDMEVDFISLGAGIGGMSAAIIAHDEGLQCLVLEKSAKVGGVAALSLGQLWVPGNHVAAAAGITDTWQAGHEYIKWMGGGYGHEELSEVLCRLAPQVVRHFETNSGLKWVLYKHPDYFYPFGNGSLEDGRYIEVKPIAGAELGDWASKSRRGIWSFVTNNEAYLPGAADLFQARVAQDARAMGAGLGSYLLRAALQRNIPILTEVRTEELLRENGRVVGLVAVHEGRTLRIRARRGVLVAVSGYDWSKPLTSVLDTRPGSGTFTNPAVTGDHLRLAGILGAKVLSISARPQWVGIAYRTGGQNEEGMPDLTPLVADKPSLIFVNRRGRRFCDESWGPSHVAALSHTDILQPGVANQPFWAIWDSHHQARYPLQRSPTDLALPKGTVQASTLGELGKLAGIDPAGLEREVAEFNVHAERGEDPQFGRGTRALALAHADMQIKPNPILGPIKQGPFFAIPLEAVSIGIPSAGLVGDVDARVLDWNDRPIPGLYVAGNSMAMLDLGIGYQSGLGNTRGMVFGYLAAKHAKSSIA